MNAPVQIRPDMVQPLEAPKPVVAVDNLNISFRQGGAWTEVVRNLSFSISPGETLALVGESGSGKSVSALSLLRLLPKRQTRVEGDIVIAGRSIMGLTDKQMLGVRGRDVGMIFQEPMTSLNPVHTVGYQIAEVLRQHRRVSAAEARADVLHLLDQVRIPDAKRRIDQFPHELSGGMRQRIMIAMAIALRPKLLIADEPTTALDVTVQAQILDLLQTLQDEMGTAILFITHDMGVVAEISDRTLVMRRGDVVEAGRTQDIFASPEHDYTRLLISSIPKLGAAPDQVRQATLAADAVPVLEVSNLVCKFPVRGGFLGTPVANVHAVQDISFSIGAGETLSLVGESGCGKSTTGRCVLQLTKPTSGTVKVEGQDIGALDKTTLRDARRRMQMIFQDPFGSFNPRRTVGMSISEPMRVHGMASGAALQDRTADLLRRVGLSPDMASRYPHQFSGGQRQRLCIARALGLEPRLLIADEPVSALDVSIKGQIVDLLIGLQETMGLSYLFISHDMSVVEAISHRVAVMYLGEIVEIGPRVAVFGNPLHSYTRKLLAAVPVPDPNRRRARRQLVPEELRTPVHSLHETIVSKPLVEMAPGHFVQAE